MSFQRPTPGAAIRPISDICSRSGMARWSNMLSLVLLFTGVSRSLTHELVRHRAGWFSPN